MSKVERLQSECPPDAHKVIRPPENKLNASLAVFVSDSELDKYNASDLCEVLALMNESPLIYCSNKVKEAIIEKATEAQIKPRFLIIHEDHTASINYTDGSQSSAQEYFDLSSKDADFTTFLDKLACKCFIIVDSLSMLILRSISTVYPWDKLLAGDFVRQYIKAKAMLTDNDISKLLDIRYGKLAPTTIENTDAYTFLRLERKLFLQYPTDD